MSPETRHSFLIDAAAAGERLDRYLVKQCPELSRSRLKALIETGEVSVGAAAAKPSHILRAGERVVLRVPPPVADETLPEDLPLDILFEDKDLLVLDKSAEMVVHLGSGVRRGTLVNALLHHCRDLSGIGGKERPGIVHRLDKGTSGLMVVAKSDRAHRYLSEQFKNREVEKTYFAFVWGEPKRPSGKIDLALGRSVRDRKKIDTRGPKLRSAVTLYRLVETWGRISLLELKPQTGRTHQLRVHLAELGHPIVGDPTYGRGITRAGGLSEAWKKILAGIRFQLLHAGELVFRHPVRGKRMEFRAPLRREMVDFQTRLRKGIS